MKILQRKFQKTGLGLANPAAQALAQKSGVSIHTLQSIYLGRRIPSKATAAAIRAALK